MSFFLLLHGVGMGAGGAVVPPVEPTPEVSYGSGSVGASWGKRVIWPRDYRYPKKKQKRKELEPVLVETDDDLAAIALMMMLN
jgi:hypothetical protein